METSKPQNSKNFGSRKSIKDFQGNKFFDSFRIKNPDSHRKFNFRDHQKSKISEIKVLDFTGKWCSTCIVLDKLMEAEIIPKYKSKVKFIKIDVDEDENLIKQYEIMSIPTLIMLKKDKEIWRKSSSISKEEIVKELDKIIK